MLFTRHIQISYAPESLAWFAPEWGVRMIRNLHLDRVLSLRKLLLAGKIDSCPQSIIDKIEDILQHMREDGVDL
jgi:hypothetical protein